MADYRIFKYPVPLTDSFAVDMPQSCDVLDVQVQDGKPVMWALVHPDAPKVSRRFRLIGTGQPIDVDERFHLSHVKTIQLAEGTLVFHLFEVVPREDGR